ncbi:hypothetical protein J3R30DRAFT_3662168 [Lentinula aciculospora]|uniref:Short-chain dehydrogenase n=1 Tax=Lentinula aciculospora TaxID=153920 RepID=A0A9W8ZXW7_9AGAR|nr:hypothetical protein J3R30DRAFT_3662168 [Lentinula aciculospora]
MYRFACEQHQTIKPVVKVDLTGKTVVVTGGNGGLGFEAAKHFATMNPARLIIACRSEAKGKAAVSKLSQDTGYTKAEVWLLDLSRFASVCEFADRFERDGGRLDILVENAGIVAMPSYERTEDEYASIFQTNDIAPSLHTLLLLPAMIKTAEEHNTKPRIVIVSSDVHFRAMSDKTKEFMAKPNMIEALSSLDYHNKVPVDNHYFDSKLLNLFFARALHARLSKYPSIIVDAVNPGYCYSGFRTDYKGSRAVVDHALEKIFAITTEEGGRQIVWAAVGGSGAEETLRGGYVSFGEVVEPSDFSISKEGLALQEKYWNQQLAILKGIDPRIEHIVHQFLQN